jgi:heme A synthase
MACGLLVVAAGAMARAVRPNDRAVSLCSRALTGVFVAQLLVGLANVALLAPVAIQLVHLLLADAVWVGLVLLAATTLGERDVEVRMEGTASSVV